MFENGYLSIGRWRGAPVRLHWTLPIGAFVFGRGQLVPAFWLGFVLLIFIHEMGHAFVVDRCRARVFSIDIHGLGGMCRWAGHVSPTQRAMIAWGGVWAQLALLVGTHVALFALGNPTSQFTLHLVDAFVATNLLVMAINLVPIPPLDGAEAWPLAGLLYRRVALARAARRKRRELAERRRQMARFHVVRDDDEVKLTPEVQAVVDEALDRLDPRRTGKR